MLTHSHRMPLLIRHYSHDHGGPPALANSKQPEKRGPSSHRLLICFGLTLVFMVVEGLAGVFTHSLALLSDALHMLSDAVALGLAAGAAHISLRKPTAEKSFGFKRFEVLAAFTNGLVLLLLSSGLAYRSIVRFWEPETILVLPMMIVAAAGLLLNLGILLSMRSQTEKTLNEDGVYWHVLGDALSSIGVLLAGILVFWHGYQWADPAAGLMISIVLGFGSWRILRKSAHILVEGTPEGVDQENIRKAILEAPQVHEVHDLHLWSLNGQDLFLSAHIKTIPGPDSDQKVVEGVKHILREHYGVHHITLQSGQCEAGDCGNGCSETL